MRSNNNFKSNWGLGSVSGEEEKAIPAVWKERLGRQLRLKTIFHTSIDLVDA